MSIEYTIKIYRKKDQKLIGHFHANYLKTIFDSEFCDSLGCRSRYDANNIRFEYSDLTNLITRVEDRIKLIQLKNSERKFQIALATSVEIKEELERANDEYQIYIDEDLRHVIYAAIHLQGAISCIVENNIDLKTDEAAYQYNGIKTDKENDTIWVDDIECEICAC